MEPVFPLDHHPKMLIVEEQYFDGDFFTITGGHLLNVHEETAVPVDVNDQFIWMCYFCAHGCGQAKSHRSQTEARQPRPRFPELVELGRPHLMLTHTGGDDCVTIFGELPKLVNGLLWKNGLGMFPISEGLCLLPVFDLCKPVGNVLRWLDDLVEFFQSVFEVAHNANMSVLHLV